MRRTLLENLKTLVENTVPGTYVALWDGVEGAFNVEERWPAVFVAYGGCDFEAMPEVGATTWTRTFHFWVYVCARDVLQALDLLDALESGLTGKQLAPEVSPLKPQEFEELVGAELSYFVYAQAYACEELKSTV